MLVRLINFDGSYLGIVTLPEALSKASDLNMDLIKISGVVEPYVYKLGDYNKYKYFLKKKKKSGSSNKVITKEIHLNIYSEKLDYQVKLNKVINFLNKKYYVIVFLFSKKNIINFDILNRYYILLMKDLNLKVSFESSYTFLENKFIIKLH